MSLLIKGGTIATGSDCYVADVLIDGETVVAVGTSLDHQADEVIDATGKYLLPGGIDVHTHMSMPFGGTVTCDDFTSGTISAAFGGTTTIIDFAMQLPGQTPRQGVAGWREKLERDKPVVDVCLHLAVTDLSDPGALDDLAKLPDEGVTSFKLFMAYKDAIMVDDETLFRAMLVAADTHSLVLVHAENGDAVEVLRQQALAAGHTTPEWHARTRPPITEGEATSRAIDLAGVANAPLYVVHVSCQAAIEPIARARAAGRRVWGETCTQYLHIDETYLSRPDFEGGKYIFTPPARPREEHDNVWRALQTDVLSAVSSDHAPFRWRDQKTLGRDDFTKIPNGAPGVEDRLPVVHQLGVNGGRIDLRRFVELTATNPARLFGLYPRKGTIAVGSDADIAIWDLARPTTISVDAHHSNVDYNLFEGLDVVGMPEKVLVRGKLVVGDGELLGQPGDGRFVARERVGIA